MSTMTLSLPQTQPSSTREVTRRRLSLRRVEVQPGHAQNRESRPSPSPLATVKSAVARLEALMRENRSHPADAAGAADETPLAKAQAVPLETLLGGANTLAILHNGEVYTLRKTRYGKLILTK